MHEKKQKVNSLICPKCGGSLVIRNGPYGSFYGCSNYPSCRFKQNY
ncbi:MAG: topoisomerase DNA-binding C4 zinc finger domain-containing protein [Treponema sp.]|nr:topoisomerase DNA-binding C4 zinc finger domain-containing protein [Treponema sp.]